MSEEQQPEEETPQLFYAYAIRVRDYTFTLMHIVPCNC